MPAFSDDLWLGNAPGPQVDAFSGGKAFRGVGPLGRVYVFDVVPTILDADGVCVAQAIAGAADALINGALATGGVGVMDVARALQMVSTGAGDTTQTVTVYGTDYWGQAQSEVKTLNGTTPVLFLKAFKTVTRVAVSAVMAGNLSLGTRDAIGLPFRVTNVAYVVSVKWNSTLAQDGGTFVAAVTTDPNTASIGDVRGTYLPSNAADGSKRLVMCIAIPAIGAGPDATQVGAIGVTPA